MDYLYPGSHARLLEIFLDEYEAGDMRELDLMSRAVDIKED